MSARDKGAGENDARLSAYVLVEQHGENARVLARTGAGKMAVKGDLESAARWRRIADAIDQLLDEISPDEFPPNRTRGLTDT